MTYKVWTKEDVIKVLEEASEKANYSCKEVPVVISKNLITTGGYFRGIFTEAYGGKKYVRADCFTFSYFYLNGVMRKENVKQLILHEYAHFLTIDKTKESHNHDELFKKNCKKIGCTLYDGSFKSYVSDEPSKYKYTITCRKCNNRFGENRLEKNYTNKYCCTHCSGEFKIEKNW